MSPIGCLDHSFHSGRYVDGIKAMVKDNSAVSLAPSIWYLSFLAHNPLSPFLQVQRTSCHPPPCLLSNDLCDPHEHTIRTASHAQHSRSRILELHRTRGVCYISDQSFPTSALNPNSSRRLWRSVYAQPPPTGIAYNRLHFLCS